MDDEKPKTRWVRYVIAFAWAAVPIAMVWVVPQFQTMFREMGCWELPLSTRVVVGTPATAWVALGVVASGALIWTSKALPRAWDDLVDPFALIALGLFVELVVIALLLPLAT